MPGFAPASGWYPGDAAVGYHVQAAPALYAQTAVFQKGVATSNFTLTQPGTVGSGTAVSNTTGVDAVVYASATAGISAAKVGTASVPGSIPAAQGAQYTVLASSSLTLTYGGTLTWLWLPA
jgi:hypothetical protein